MCMLEQYELVIVMQWRNTADNVTRTRARALDTIGHGRRLSVVAHVHDQVCRARRTCTHARTRHVVCGRVHAARHGRPAMCGL